MQHHITKPSVFLEHVLYIQCVLTMMILMIKLMMLIMIRVVIVLSVAIPTLILTFHFFVY